MQFGYDIEISTKFIDYLIQIVSNNKYYNGEIKTLVDNALLMLKQAGNDDIIIQGNINKQINFIW